MRKISTLFYGIGQGIKNIFRNRVFSLASIGTMAACLFLFGVFYVVLTNLEYMVKSAETNVGITVFFDENITQEQIEAISGSIKLRAEVYDVEYTSADEAWNEYRSTKLSPELAASFGNDNPLENSASLTVFLNDVTMQDSLVNYITGQPGVRKCNDATEISKILGGFNKILAIASGIIIAILLGVAAFLIGITISTGISVRRQEISIMKLIGAADHFIRIPYVVEGILIGILGALIPVVVLRTAYSGVTGAIEQKFSSMFNVVTLLPAGDVMKLLVPITFAIGIGVGLISCLVTLKKQLRKIEQI